MIHHQYDEERFTWLWTTRTSHLLLYFTAQSNFKTAVCLFICAFIVLSIIYFWTNLHIVCASVFIIFNLYLFQSQLWCLSSWGISYEIHTNSCRAFYKAKFIIRSWNVPWMILLYKRFLFHVNIFILCKYILLIYNFCLNKWISFFLILAASFWKLFF